VTVILVAAPRTVVELDVPLNVPSAPQFVGILPPAAMDVIPPAASRLNAADKIPPPARHVTPKTGSLICHAAPEIVALIAVMFGRVPLKLAYLVCQGRVAARMVALPVPQAPNTALVMNPARIPAVLVMVLA